MDWKPLLKAAVPYVGPPLTASGLDERVSASRARFRAYVDAVRALEAPKPAPAPTFGDVVAALFGPAEVIPTFRKWRDARPSSAGGEGSLDRLERRVEDAQREVSRVALRIDALREQEQLILAEMDTLRAHVDECARNATLAREATHHLGAGRRAIELARLRALPIEGAALDADDAMLASLEQARHADDALYTRAAERLGELVSRGAEALELCARLRGALEKVHHDGHAMLDELDRHLGRLAAEARAADLGASLAANMDALRESIGRVGLSARAGADALEQRLDRLAERPDLLAPADPERASAEVEVDALMRRR